MFLVDRANNRKDTNVAEHKRMVGFVVVNKKIQITSIVLGYVHFGSLKQVEYYTFGLVLSR